MCFSKANQVLETFLGSSFLDLVAFEDLTVFFGVAFIVSIIITNLDFIDLFSKVLKQTLL